VILLDKIKTAPGASTTSIRYQQINTHNQPTILNSTRAETILGSQKLVVDVLADENINLSVIQPTGPAGGTDHEIYTYRLAMSPTTQSGELKMFTVLQATDSSTSTGNPVKVSGNNSMGLFVNNKIILMPKDYEVENGGVLATDNISVTTTEAVDLIITGLDSFAAYNVLANQNGGQLEVSFSIGGSYVSDNSGILYVNIDSSRNVTAVINNQQGSEPMIISDGGGSTATININENSTNITTVTATEPNNLSIAYSITSGADAGLFNINTSSGELSFNNAPDYENPVDTNQDNIYEVEVQASSAGGSDSQIIYINILDVNEGGNNNSPTDIQINNQTFLNINENIPANSNIGVLTTADPDSSDNHTYSLVSGVGDEDNAKFSISGNNLVINFSPDYENPTDLGDTVGNNTYTVRIQTDDGNGGTYSKSFIVTVNDVNEGGGGSGSGGGGSSGGGSGSGGGGGASTERVCKDTKAINFKPKGIHKQSLCEYADDSESNEVVDDSNLEDDGLVTDNQFQFNGGGLCPADKILTENLKTGDRNGRYS
jgi:hypothetical protein